MVGFSPTTDSEGYLNINGLGVRLDFRSSTLKVGRVVGEKIKDSGWVSPSLDSSSNDQLLIKPGTFQPFSGGTILLSNLDQFDADKITIQISYACNDNLTVTVWGDIASDLEVGTVVAS